MLVLRDITFGSADSLVETHGASRKLGVDIIQATHHGLEYFDVLYWIVSPKYVLLPTGSINIYFNPDILTTIERFKSDFDVKVIVSCSLDNFGGWVRGKKNNRGPGKARNQFKVAKIHQERFIAPLVKLNDANSIISEMECPKFVDQNRIQRLIFDLG